RARTADVRVIAATNRPQTLRPEFHRRFGLRVDVPDLDARQEDVPLIARCLANRAARQEPTTWRPFLSQEHAGEGEVALDFVRALVGHGYAGNVRELEALLWASLRESGEGRLETPREIALEARSPDSMPDLEEVPTSPATDPRSLDPSQIQACLDQHGGSIE